MTVQELISQLEKIPGEYEVQILTDVGEFDPVYDWKPVELINPMVTPKLVRVS